MTKDDTGKMTKYKGNLNRMGQGISHRGMQNEIVRDFRENWQRLL